MNAFDEQDELDYDRLFPATRSTLEIHSTPRGPGPNFFEEIFHTPNPQRCYVLSYPESESDGQWLHSAPTPPSFEPIDRSQPVNQSLKQIRRPKRQRKEQKLARRRQRHVRRSH